MEAEDHSQITTMRESLKAFVQEEVEKLPELFESLEPKDRLSYLCRLMPFVFPKIEAVHQKEGEPLSFDW
jgi:hypothetical protein